MTVRLERFPDSLRAAAGSRCHRSESSVTGSTAVVQVPDFAARHTAPVGVLVYRLGAGDEVAAAARGAVSRRRRGVFVVVVAG